MYLVAAINLDDGLALANSAPSKNEARLNEEWHAAVVEITRLVPTRGMAASAEIQDIRKPFIIPWKRSFVQVENCAAFGASRSGLMFHATLRELVQHHHFRGSSEDLRLRVTTRFNLIDAEFNALR